MCVILIKNKKTKLDLETLILANKQNPDGFGFAYLEDGWWRIEKHLKPTAETLKEAVKKTKGKKAVFHFRIATSGGVNLKNCQPFCSEKFILFHNGVVQSLNGVLPDISDTGILSLILEKTGLNKKILLENLAQKTGSRFALVSGNNIEAFGSWKSYKGLKVSNLYFIPKPEPRTLTFDTFTSYEDYLKKEAMSNDCRLWSDCFDIE